MSKNKTKQRNYTRLDKSEYKHTVLFHNQSGNSSVFLNGLQCMQDWEQLYTIKSLATVNVTWVLVFWDVCSRAAMFVGPSVLWEMESTADSRVDLTCVTKSKQKAK